MQKVLSVIVLAVFLTTGCSSSKPVRQQAQMGNLLLAEPAPANPRTQVAIARYNQILTQAELDDADRAELHYQRGILYDSVGLPGLAQFDYSQALSLKPDLAPAYNSIGVHFVQQNEFIQAYEAFDSTLDIDPEYDFAFLNRGIALYYGGRPDLAVSDLTRFEKLDTLDPFRSLWLYYATVEVDPGQALEQLKANKNKLDPSHWAIGLVDLYLGVITEAELLGDLLDGITSQQELTARLCEAYFYLGKFHSAKNNRGIAANYFKLALSTNVYEYVEHRYARLELNRLRKSADANE